MTRHRFVVSVSTSKSGGGTFKSSDEVGDIIREAIEGADPGSVEVDGVEYDVDEYDVEEIDVRGEVMPWTPEQEAASQARIERRRVESAKRAEATAEYAAREREREAARAANPTGRVYLEGSYGTAEVPIDLDPQYGRIVFEFPGAVDGNREPLELHVSRDGNTRLKIRQNGFGTIVMRPWSGNEIVVAPSDEW